MKKCIFWDDEDNKFLTWDEVEFEKLKNEEVMVWKQIDPISKECRLFESFDDTELKDINGKSIYANSSIVEFGYSAGEAVHIGYFYYDKDNLAYKIKILSSVLRSGKSNKFKGQSFLFDSGMIDFKIIDTIQERDLRKNVL